MSYVVPGTPRFTIKASLEGETLVIPARRDAFLVLSLTAWFGGWTIGGIAAIIAFLTSFHPFLAFWLCGWAVGWLMVLGVLSWMLTGRQSLRVIGSDLEIQTSAMGFTRRALYRGRDIGYWRASPEAGYAVGRQFPPMPVLGESRGAVRFSYGGRMCSTGFGLDETEALAVVDWLRKRLPEVKA